MRRALIDILLELAETDKRILLLTADLGYTVVERFADAYPERFFNVGVAEQNMVGVATGLAEAGFIPYVYSITPFSVLRTYEFIRNGPIMHQLPVRIVGVGAGFDYGHNGLTHYGVEDVAVMRAQPGIAVIVPADAAQAATALRATARLPGPVYYCLTKDAKTAVPGLNGRFDMGSAQTVREGKDILLVALGRSAVEAVKAADILATKGVTAGVVVVASVSPAPKDALAEALRRVGCALTIESHFTTGGVGSLVSEIVAERGLKCRVMRQGIKTAVTGVCGSKEWLENMYGISPDALAASALALLSGSSQH
jgi:transketolase